MKLDLKPYSKLIAALVGVLAIVAGPEVLGLTENSELLTQSVLAVLTLFGVYQVTNTDNSAKSPAVVGLLALLLTMTMLSGCGVMQQRPQVNNSSDAIAVTSAEIESLATEVHRLCGNDHPLGECMIGAPISTDTKNDFKDYLQEAQNAVNAANTLLNVRDAAGAQKRLDQAEALLIELRKQLAKEKASE